MSNTDTAPAFDIEYNHTDSQIAEFAPRCGCPKCGRYRATHLPPVLATTPAPVVGSVPPGVPALVVPVAAPVLCTCPLGVRGVRATDGACSSCGLRRRPQPAAAPRSIVRDLDAQRASGSDAESVLRGQLAKAEETIAALKRNAINTRTYVAGAKSVAEGIFLGFAGLGQVTRAQLLRIVEESGLPAEWAPAAKSAHAQAGKAVGALNGRGYIVRSDKSRAAKDANGRDIPRSWKARWIIGQQVGSTFPAVATATLTVEGKLVVEGGSGAVASVTQEFEALCAADTYASTDITQWLSGVMAQRFRGVKLGGNWYVRARNAEAAERLCTRLSKAWGREWLLPAVPMAASDELAIGISRSFTADARAVLAMYREERDAKDENGKVIGIGARRAATLHSEIRELAERAVGFAAMLGEKHVATIRAELAAVANEIDESTDGMVQRFELIFDELARDAK